MPEEDALSARDAAELLYRNGIGGIVATALASVSLVVSSRSVPQSGLIVWLCVMLLVSALRMYDLIRSRRRRATSGWDGRVEINRFGVGVLAAAAAWVAFPLLFFTELSQIERTTMAMTFSAMAGASATVLAAKMRLAIVYCAALLLPGSFMFLFQAGGDNMYLGALGVFFFCVMAAASKVTHRTTMSAIRLHRANQVLLEGMERERQRTEDANAGLRSAQEDLRESLETLEDRIRSRTADLEHEIQERERYGRQLAELASTDSLTGLANRATLTERLGFALANAERSGEPLAVMFLDLDKFKEVNDVKGHESGDQVLRAVAQRFGAIVPVDAIAARWGGDEFVFVLHEADGARDAVALAARLRRSVSKPIVIGAGTVRVDATIGIAFFPDHGRTPDELIRAADVAMYAGKEDGHGQVRVFDPHLADVLRNRHFLQQALRDAIADDTLHLVFQPIVAASSGRCEAFEALLRWVHPQYGSIAPVDFIPLAERSGDIITIGRWVLVRACAAAMSWPGASPPAVSVNVSVAQILAGTLVEDVCAALSSSGLPPRRLHLEVTESLFASDQDVIVPTLEALRAMGIRILLDDFGTGFSSFGILHTLPIDVIKIDKSFIDKMDGESAPIVEAIRSLGRALDLELIAEGVETASQAALLAAMDVQYLQGYYFARPLEERAVSAWLFDPSSAHREGQAQNAPFRLGCEESPLRSSPR